MRKEISPNDQLLARLSGVPSLITEIESRLARDGRLGIQIGLQEGLLLRSLCSLPQVRQVVEIGTQYGCSATWMAMGLGQRGQIWTLEKDPQCLEQARQTFASEEFKALKTSVHLLEGEAQESLAQLSSRGPFDLVFIDANKAATHTHWQWALNNTQSGALILVDNVYLFGSVFSEERPENVPAKMWTAMTQTLNSAFQEERVASSLLPTPEGLLLSIRR